MLVMHIFYFCIVVSILFPLFFNQFRKINRLEKANSFMLKISNELSKNESLDTLYKKTLEYTIDVIKNTKYGSILILNKDTGLLEFKAIIGSDIDQFSKTTLPVHELFLYTIN